MSYGFGAHHDKWGITDQQVSCSAGDCGTSPIGNLAYTGESSGAPYDGTSPLYGAMQSGGSNGSGLVYELTPNGVNTWTETVLYNFCSSGGDKCTDGKFPSGGLSLDSTGNLFGLTQQGGNNFDSTGAGVAFEISPNQGSWTETTLYQFCSVANCTDGAMPVGGLAADAAGVLYGVTLAGGSCKRAKSFGCGTAFSLIPAGGNTQEAVLYTFCTKRDCRDGSFPEAGLILDGSGNLFGTTETGGGNDIDDRQQGGGVAYEISGTSLNVLHSFCSLAGCADGEYPAAQLIFDENGNLMGTATVGGAFGSGTSGGTVFQIR